MARKAPVNQSRFARREGPRQTATKPLLKFFLIVCEGTKTEPNYFNGMKENLPPNVLRVADFDATGTGKNTLSVVDEAIKLKANYEKDLTKPVDEVWAVFDRDSFPKGKMNAAIQRAEANQIQCAWTNEAFELWYILHFQLVEHAMSRDDYRKYLERELSRCSGTSYTYQKNSLDMFSLLIQHGDINQAIKRAERLATAYENRTDYANHNPRTEMHVLVQRILEFEKKDKKILSK
jgi:hypothetical protein